MVPIVYQWCPTGRYGIKCPFERDPDRIVVHNTGNDAPAKNEITYMLNRPEEISFHLAIDDKEIRQAIPFNRNAWASGDGCGPGNMKGIHIEICYSLSGGPRFEASEKNAAEYIASLLHEFGWGLDKVTKHQDYDGKKCPHRTLDLGWGRYLNTIKTYYDLQKEDKVVTYEQWCEYYKRYINELESKPVDKWAKESWDKAVNKKIFDGNSPRGPLTREQAAAVFDRMGLISKK